MSRKLEALIKAVRACKAPSEVQSVIAKESALIRTAIRNQDARYRDRNVSKLLYIHMLGYPTHFGHMECINLCASPKFSDKRTGYLALMLLLDENQKELMLVTHALQRDFTSRNPYVAGLALAVFGNVASPDMARDLAPEIEKFFRSPNAYLRKKAALCALRVVRKVPEMVEDFVSGAQTLVLDKNHAVALAAATLMLEMIKIDPRACVQEFRKSIPDIVRVLRTQATSKVSLEEYDVLGVRDPFLQVKLIQLLQHLGRGSVDASQQMNDVLAQIAISSRSSPGSAANVDPGTGGEGSRRQHFQPSPNRNPLNAVLYATVMAIMNIEAEGGLRVLAINILGRFLINPDNNIRYVALNTLCQVVHRDADAIQRHRSIVVGCLKDLDISIRRRALDLIYALVTPGNVSALVKELLVYLGHTNGDDDFKADLTQKICLVAERFAPSLRWHIDALVAVLHTAGRYTDDRQFSDFVSLVSQSSPELQAYSVHQLAALITIQAESKHEKLLQALVWIVGEYGASLVSIAETTAASQLLSEGQESPLATGDADDSSESIAQKKEFQMWSEAEVLQMLCNVREKPLAGPVVHRYLLNALLKCAGRTSSPEIKSRVTQVLGDYVSSQDVELQQRAVEFLGLVNLDSSVLQRLVAQLPPLPPREQERDMHELLEDLDDESDHSESDSEESSDDSDEEGRRPVGSELSPGSKQTSSKTSSDPFDILDLFDSVATGASSGSSNTQQASSSDLDLLGDIFGSGPPPASASASTATPTAAANHTAAPTSNGADLLPDLLGFGDAPLRSNAPVSSKPAAPPGVTVVDQQGLTMSFSFTPKAAQGELTTEVRFTSLGQGPISDLSLFVAVPKSVDLQMFPADASALPTVGSSITQRFETRQSNPSKKLKIRYKISYSLAGQSKEIVGQFDQFP